MPYNDRARPLGSELKRHGSIHMSSTEDRLRKIINENLDLDHEPDFDRAFSEAGFSSLDAVAFFKLVNQEFDLGMAAEDCLQFQNLRDLVTHIDSRAG